MPRRFCSNPWARRCLLQALSSATPITLTGLPKRWVDLVCPTILKSYRKAKKYLFLGTSFDRDTDRMVANELTLDLEGGYVITDKPLGKKEEKFIQKHNLEVVAMSLEAFCEAFIS